MGSAALYILIREEIFQILCRMLEIKKTRTSARNPRCNDHSERTLEDDKGLFEK